MQLNEAQIISKFHINRINSVANRRAQSCEFRVQHISRTALASLKFFCIPCKYYVTFTILVFGRHRLNRGAISPEAPKKSTFSVLIRLFLNVLSCNFIFRSSLPILFQHINFNSIR
ncbi:hypothetical protein O3M35_006476 [Rhynocoris fuscipes]|uniref:Uncharacterized protein n=1 Tax=Rhynocoris fuscipes TaxID=488301 RepID=A0AAW1DG21_9HEMI